MTSKEKPLSEKRWYPPFHEESIVFRKKDVASAVKGFIADLRLNISTSPIIDTLRKKHFGSFDGSVNTSCADTGEENV